MARDLRTYSSYRQMLNRCLNTNNDNYHHYGGRGIKVCDRWLESYANFLEDMGVRPEDTTLDRKDNDLNYGLENCRWSTHAEQSYNRSSSYWFVVYYDNVHGYSDEQLAKYFEMPDLKMLMVELNKRYPLSTIDGGIKFINSQRGVASFAILKSMSDKDPKIGDKINSLTLVKPVKVGEKNKLIYEWLCDCGKTITAYGHRILSDGKISCGCHRHESSEERGYIAGYKNSRVYGIWQSIRVKCKNTKHISYKNNGAKGFSVCQRWDLYENFLTDMGHPETEGASLKIRAGEKVYSKENCYWDNVTRI